MKSIHTALLLLFSSFTLLAQRPPSVVDSTILKHLVNSVGISREEAQCIEQQDKKCLFDFYSTQWFSQNPLSNIIYSDTVSWKTIADRFRKYGSGTENMKVYFAMNKRSAIFYYLAGNAVNSNYALQNMGFLYEESEQLYDSSVYFINLALSRWEEMRDTLPTANLYKYRAYLSTKTDLVKDGKADGQKAIALYSLKGNRSGVMVSYRDLATIFIKEQRTDSANFYLYQCKEYWTEQKDTGRMVGINTELILANLSDAVIAEKVLAENDMLISYKKLYPIELSRYYDAAILYADRAQNKLLKEKYARYRAEIK